MHRVSSCPCAWHSPHLSPARTLLPVHLKARSVQSRCSAGARRAPLHRRCSGQRGHRSERGQGLGAQHAERRSLCSVPWLPFCLQGAATAPPPGCVRTARAETRTLLVADAAFPQGPRSPRPGPTAPRHTGRSVPPCVSHSPSGPGCCLGLGGPGMTPPLRLTGAPLPAFVRCLVLFEKQIFGSRHEHFLLSNKLSIH